MKRIVVSAALLAFLWAISGPAAQAAEVEFQARVVTLKSPCYDFALNPATGDLVGIDPKANTATLYPKAYLEQKSKTVVGPVNVGKTPSAVIYKRYKGKSYFVVACYSDPQMSVLDPRTLKVVRQIKLTSDKVSSLATSADPSDPYVYCACGDVVRVSMATMRDEGDVTVRGRHGSLMHLALSANGKFLYGLRSGSPTGFMVFQQLAVKADGKTVWQQTFYDHRSVTRYVPGPSSQYVATYEKVHSADLKTEVAEVEFDPRCFFPGRPVLIGIADGEETDYDIVAASSNSFKVCGRAPLPDEFGKTPKYGPFKLRCLPDGANNRVVAARGSEATLIPLKRLSVPDEPFLLLHLKTPQSASLGTRLAIPFKPHDPACKVALAAAPKGVRLVGNSVVWTPTESQVGRANVALRLSHKGFERVQNVSFDVVRRHVKIGFVPDAFRVSPSGRTVVAWTGGARDRWRGRDDEQPAKCRVAVIDTEQGKVVASKLLLNPISAAAVDDHYVYVAPAHADRISALSLKDLSEAKKSHTKGRVIGFTCVSSKLLFAATEEHVLTYSVPDLKPVDLPAYPTAKEEGSDRSDAERVLRYAKRPYARRPLRVMRYDEGEPEMPERLPAGFYAGGCVFDPDFAKARMLVDVRGFPALEVERVNPAKPPAAWDRSVGDGGQILTSQGRRVGRWEQSSVIISRDYPIGVALSAVRGDGDDYERVSVDLSLFDLVSAKLVKKIPLIKRSEADGRFDGFGDVVRGGALHLAGRKVIVLLRDRLFTYTIDEELLRKLPAPFGFEPPREVATVSAKGKSRIEHKLRGGQKPFQFDLTTSRKGIEIDKRSGTVTIDGPLLLKDAMAQIGQAVGERLRDAARDDEATVPAAKIVAGFANPLKARFKKLVGRDPGGIPVLVPIGLAASDKSQRVASLDYQVVLEVPEGVVVKAMEIIVRAIEQRRKEIATERAERERRWRERAKPTPVPVPKKPDDDRVEKLEKRITALEAKLDLLMKLLEPLRSREKEK